MIEQTIPKELLELSTVQQKCEEELLDKANVVGVALGNRIRGNVETEQPVISVLVTHRVAPELLSNKDRVQIKGVETDVVEVGNIFAEGATVTVAERPKEKMAEEEFLEEVPMGEAPVPVTHLTPPAPSPSLTRRLRPALGGFSVGPYRGPTGTIATGCYDLIPFPSVPPRFYLLSNNHVLAGTNRFPHDWPILQPGLADGGSPRDVIGRLYRYIPIRFGSGTNWPINYVDAAIADVNLEDLDREVFWVGRVQRLYSAPMVGDIVQKAGRTTGFTTGRVRNVNATVNVNYGGGRVARFARQIITTRMSAPGDSGSLVTNRDEGAVGLLFAGSPTITILNNILFVQSLLQIRLTEK